MKHIFTCLLSLICIIHGLAQVNYSKGLVFDADAYEKVPKKVSLIRGDYEQLPQMFSIKSFCPRPGSQIQLATSSSWATSYAAMTIMEAEAEKLTNQRIITQNSYSPVFNYALATDFQNNNCTAPVSLNRVLESMKRYGVPKYTDFQIFCPDSIPSELYKIAGEHKIGDFARLFDLNDAPAFKLESVKKSLAESIPVIIGLYCPPSFSSAKEFWQPREELSKKFAVQALCIIGYDDTRYGGAFEVLNSWGSNWGNNGFMWIRYPDFTEFTTSAYEIFMFSNESNNIDFSGKIKLVLENGSDIPVVQKYNEGYYHTPDVYKTGTNFKIIISNNETAYVYVFGTDETNEYFQLFPYNDNVSPVLNYKNSSIVLPAEDYYIQITGNPGRDYLVIIYSKEEIQLGTVMKRMKSLSGNLIEKLQTVLTSSLVDGNNINWNKEDIRFSGHGNGRTMLPVIIEIQHN